jgi:molybdate transport system ATP-binding protein
VKPVPAVPAVPAVPVGPAPGDGLSVSAVVRRGEFVLDVALDVGAGEVVAVLGPNGAGKTTLLRALAGLTALSHGRVTLSGQVLDDVDGDVFRAPENRPVGLVFQNYRLFPHLSVRDNVAFAARSRGTRRGPARAAAGHWLERLELSELADRKPDQLSGGQAQRVALARALASEPLLLLLDEPTAALDARTRLAVRRDLRRHLSAFAGPTVLVTHDPLEAMVMADRLVVIEGGRIVQVGVPAEVARRPATQYVARLVGLNLYAGNRPTGTTRVELSGGGTLVAADPEPSGPVWVALRPAAVSVHTAPPSPGSPRNVWVGRIDGMELLTDRVRLQVDASPSTLVDVTPDAVAELGLIEGMAVWLSAKATDVDVYPAP